MGTTSPDELLRDTGWIHRLSRQLAASEADAQDLVQDAWVAALRPDSPAGPEKPGGSEGGLRPWLATVLRRLAGKRRRGELRRRFREEAWARREAEAPSVEELVGRAELQQRLIGLVTVLEEPYRATILLRYFEGLELREIARRCGVPASTVRSRHQRALAQLRRRLDAETGGREAWATLLWQVGRSRGPAAPPALVPAPAVLLGSAVAMLGLGLLALARPERAPARSLLSSVTGARTELIASSSLASAESAVSPAQPFRVRAVPRRSPTAPTAAPELDPWDCGVRGVVRDAAGRLLPKNLQVTLVDEHGAWERQGFGEEGSFEFWGLDPGTWHVAVSALGHRSAEERFTIDAAAPVADVELTLHSWSALDVQVVDAHGRFLADAWGAFQVLAHRLPLPEDGDVFAAGLVGTTARHSNSVLEDVPLQLQICEPLPVRLSLVRLGLVLRTEVVPEGAAEHTFVLDVATLTGQRTALRFRPVDRATRVPLVAAEAGLVNFPVLEPRPLEDGTVLLEVPTGVRSGLWIRADGYVPLTTRALTLTGGEVDLGDVPLERPVSIEAQLVDPSGHRLEQVVELAFEELDPPRSVEPLVGRWSSDVVGCVNLRNLRPGRYLLRGLAEDELATDRAGARGSRILLSCVVDATAGDIRGLELVAGESVSLVLRPPSPSAAGLSFLVEDGAGRPERSGGLWSMAPTLVLLAPGDHRLRVLDREVVVHERAFRLAEGSLDVTW